MFSSKTDEWATPQEFFDKLNEEFNFQLDVCADQSNAKCQRYFSKEQDGLAQSWMIPNGGQYGVTLRMAEKFLNGFRNRVKKVSCTMKLSLC